MSYLILYTQKNHSFIVCHLVKINVNIVTRGYAATRDYSTGHTLYA